MLKQAHAKSEQVPVSAACLSVYTAYTARHDAKSDQLDLRLIRPERCSLYIYISPPTLRMAKMLARSVAEDYLYSFAEAPLTNAAQAGQLEAVGSHQQVLCHGTVQIAPLQLLQQPWTFKH